ncbi:hypothetical protein M405DRAFT_870372 [Rhizopogon salebrosus TDB-379]|nr:hypothetical protein M405DRAFT_870372 [Rhizopogon salebrosus TDB-379]
MSLAMVLPCGPWTQGLESVNTWTWAAHGLDGRVVNEAGVEDEEIPPNSMSPTTRPLARSRISSGLKPRPVRCLILAPLLGVLSILQKN